jgi:hypothetical protein
VMRAMWKPCAEARSLMAVAFNLTPRPPSLEGKGEEMR